MRRSERPATCPTAAEAIAARNRRAGRILFLGVVLGSLVTSSVRLSSGRNPFGPPKAAVLAAGVSLALLGLFLAPGSLARVISTLKRSRLAWALMALTGLAGLASATAFDPRRALLGGYPDYRGFVTILGFSALGVAWIAVWLREDGPRLIGRATAGLSLVPLAYAFLQRLGVFPADWRGTLRVGSLLGNPSNFGVYLLIVTPIVLWVLVAEKNVAWRIIAGVSAACSVLALIFTLSRGAWVGAIAAVGVAAALVFASSRWSVSRMRLTYASATALLLVVFAAAVTPGFLHRASRLLDASSRTGSMRLNTWASSVNMALARPLLGWGPDNYRYVSRMFQGRGQIGGSNGYQVVESAHNLLADAATSLGLAGMVAVLAVAGLSGLALTRRVRISPDPGLVIALAAALAGAFVALQFHYVTMDTGALLAMVLAGAVAMDGADADAVPTKPAARVRWVALGLCAMYAVACVGAIGVVGADALSGSATRLAVGGASWASAEREFAMARSLAPWEPEIDGAEGSAATTVLLKRYDDGAYRDGLAAFDRVIRSHPGDAAARAARANLLLVAGRVSRNRRILADAEQAFAAVESMDPNTGVATVGRGIALLSLGRTEEAVSTLKAGLKRSPRLRAGWENLAIAYGRLGENALAERARRKAQRIKEQ